jgi:hypothetical protein
VAVRQRLIETNASYRRRVQKVCKQHVYLGRDRCPWIMIVKGVRAPRLEGRGYQHISCPNSHIAYTPSDRRIEVGAVWLYRRGL